MRIIGGRLKGKTILPPQGYKARPTTDFAKEGLFNILNNEYEMEGLQVLDLFGGEAWNAEAHAALLKQAVIGILMQDAMTNTASVCGMGEETFHDAMEGLGMIMDLPRLVSTRPQA